MGRLKPLMQLGGCTVLEHQIRLFQSVGIDSPVVVVGHHADEVIPTAERLGARAVLNSRYEAGMFSSVIAGVGALRDSSIDAFFMLPVDVPLVLGIFLKRMCRIFEEESARIIYPEYRGESGHPPLISSSLIPEILKHDGAGGLRTVLANYESGTFGFETGEEGILFDMDTPDAYEKIKHRWDERQLPKESECLHLLNDYATPLDVISHSEKVSELSGIICRKLNNRGFNLSIQLAERAGLLHDVAKSLPNHAREGARILTLHGYNDIALITGQHMNLYYSSGSPITEAEILYLADKLLDGVEVCPLVHRRTESLRQKGDTPEIRNAINKRFDSAECIAAAVEELLGEPLMKFIQFDRGSK